MDQTLANTIIAKSTSALWQLRKHITAVLVHTKAPCGKLAFSFVDLLQWPHDIISLLLDVLICYKEHHLLSKTLYVQINNTSRENKNKFVLGFFAILVEQR